jgi:large subunit ribosomal protein L32
MTVPKRRQSKMKGRSRRTHYKAVPATISECPDCGNLIVPHMVCPQCGKYRGRQIVPVKKDKTESDDTPPATPSPQARTA